MLRRVFVLTEVHGILFKRTHAHTHAHTHTQVRAHTSTYIIRIFMHQSNLFYKGILLYTRAYTHAHTHTRTHTHTHLSSIIIIICDRDRPVMLSRSDVNTSSVERWADAIQRLTEET